MNINFKKLSEFAITPTRGSEDAAGYDLYAASPSEIIIEPHETVKIPTNIAIELPQNTWAGIFARSGLATKSGLRPSNCTGVIDADYRGDIIVALHNDSNKSRIIKPYERIAQLIILPFIPVIFTEVSELSDTARGDGGFGSTGTH